MTAAATGPFKNAQEGFRPRRRGWCIAIVLLYVTLVSSGCQAWAAGRTGRRIFTAVPVELLSDCRDPSCLARGLCAHLKSPASLPNSLHSPVLPFPTGPRGSDGTRVASSSGAKRVSRRRAADRGVRTGPTLRRGSG